MAAHAHAQLSMIEHMNATHTQHTHTRICTWVRLTSEGARSSMKVKSCMSFHVVNLCCHGNVILHGSIQQRIWFMHGLCLRSLYYPRFMERFDSQAYIAFKLMIACLLLCFSSSQFRHVISTSRATLLHSHALRLH